MKGSLSKFGILLLLISINCGSREKGEYIEINKITTIKNLKKYPYNYLNQVVKIRGKVVEQSYYRVWMNIAQSNDAISVDFEDKNLKLPSKLNDEVEVIGRFTKTQEGFIIKGIWVKVIK